MSFSNRERRLLRKALDLGIFYQLLEGRAVNESPETMNKQGENVNSAQDNANVIISYAMFPVKCAWLALCAWPGLSYLANIFTKLSPSYLESFGCVALVLLLSKIRG